MKRFLLLLSLMAVVVFTYAQQVKNLSAPNKSVAIEKASIGVYAPQVSHPQHPSTDGRAVDTVFMGSAGNILTVLNTNTHSLAASDDLNAVLMIHRDDVAVNPNSTSSAYRLALSTDGGMTFTKNIGPLNGIYGYDADKAGRYPQTVIHNPAGNSDLDSAYSVFIGTFHNGGDWNGHFTGSLPLSLDTALLTQGLTFPHDSGINVGISMTNGEPGVFWYLDYSDVSFDTIIINKGIWDPGTNDVIWSEFMDFVPGFDLSYDGTGWFSQAYIDFDPTGLHGWIALSGDLTNDGIFSYEPAFWESLDGGNTWSGPVNFDLDNTGNVVAGVADSTLPIAMGFDIDLTVDINGVPHLVGAVMNCSGADYTIATGVGMKIYDVTRNPNGIGTACDWVAIFIDTLATFRGTWGTDAYASDNRLQALSTEDGSKVFFTWGESDPIITGGDNSLPNIEGIGFDVVNGMMTDVANFTYGDPNIDGLCPFSVAAQTALTNGSTYTLPVSIAQLVDPLITCSFYLINDLTFNDVDFINPVSYDAVGPDISINASTTYNICLGGTYTEPTATADDACDGDVSASLVVTGTVDVNSYGTYLIQYTAEDNSGNSTTVTLPVVVNTEPDAIWTSMEDLGLQGLYYFSDASLYDPTAWTWNFGDGGGSSVQNPQHQYTADGTYTVCLEATSIFNTVCAQPADEDCQDIVVNGVGIMDLSLENSIQIYPNPSDGVFAIKVTANAFTTATVEIYNVLGEQVQSPMNITVSNNNTVSVDLSGFSSGVYYITVNTDKGSVTKKVTLTPNK